MKFNSFEIDEVRHFWDNAANTYERANEKVGYVHYQRFEKAIELANIESGQTILNIWSRTGNLIPYLRRYKNIKLFNLEVSKEFIKIATQKYPSAKFMQTDLEKLGEFKNNYFDRIISLETLEHTPKPLKLLKEFRRVLKKNGLLVMSLPPAGFEIPTRLWGIFFESHGEGPHKFLWPKEVKNLIEKAKLELISHHPAIILPLGNDKLERISEKVLTNIFGNSFLANFGVRYFYVCKKNF